MKNLICNADDFGINKSVSDAILQSHKEGFLTSTTAMANMPGFEYALGLAKKNKTLGVGIHFCLTEGFPVSDPDKVPLLLNKNGEFNDNLTQRKLLISNKEVERQTYIELEAQLQKFMDLGVMPTHYDSHHHITGLPGAFKASMNLAKKYNLLKARITSIDFRFLPESSLFVKLKYLSAIIKSKPKAFIHNKNKRVLRLNGFITPDTKILPNRVLPKRQDIIEQFCNVLKVLPNGVTEISFHPGYEGSRKEDKATTARLRVNDYNILTNEKIIKLIPELNIELKNFGDAFE